MNTTHSCRRRAGNAFEVLETRRLLSSSLSAGVLTITGTNGDDKIDVARVGGSVVVDEHEGSTASFPAAAVGTIVATLNDGNDRLTIDDTITAPTSLFGGAGNDTVKGGSGKDSIFGGSGNDNLNGSIGNDVLNGNDGNDKLTGGAGKDALNGGVGNDALDGGVDNDFLAGGVGSDTVTYASRSTPVTAQLDTDYKNFPLQVTGGGGVAGESDSYVGVENLIGGTAADTLSYAAASEPVNKSFSKPISLDGRKGNDTLSAAGVMFGGLPMDDKYSIVSEIGGDGNDLIYHDNNVSTKLYGGNGNDDFEQTMLSAAPPILVDGGAGNDRWGDANSIGGTYTIDMSHSVETLFELNSSTGHAMIKGNDSNNFIRFSGGGATASIDAMGGDDHVVIGSDPDGEFPSATTVLGGAGSDRIEDQSTGPGGVSKDKFDGGSGNDTLYGGAGNDLLIGGSGHDKLFGQAGKDTLVGNDGDKDTLDGGSGSDKAMKDGIDNVLNVETFI